MKKITLIILLYSFFSFAQEKSIIQNNFNFVPIYEWNEGMKFVFEKKSNSSLFYLYKTKPKGKIIPNSFFDNKVLLFKRHEQKPIDCLDNSCKKLYFIFESEGVEYAYQYLLGNLNDLKIKPNFNYIPDLIYYSDFEKAKEILLNKKFYKYQRTYQVHEMNGYLPITITNVEINNVENPVKISYLDVNKHIYNLNLKLSGINSRYNYSCYDENRICEFNTETIITNEEYNVYYNEKLRVANEKKHIDDSLILEKQEEYNQNREKINVIAWEEMKNNCYYQINKVDDFSNKAIKETYNYNLQFPNTDMGTINISLMKEGNEKFIYFYTTQNLGCVSPYDKSNVKIKLQNNSIITFNHIGILDCSDYMLKAKLTQEIILKLKKSPIKNIRLEGTQYYYDVSSIIFDDFFIKKLDCIE